MFKSKSHVGRPSNKELKQRRNRKILIVLFPVFGVLLVVGILLSNGSLNNLMGNSVTTYYCADSSYTLKNNKCTKLLKESPALLGDIDLNGKIEATDLNLLKQYVAEDTTSTKLSNLQLAASDIDQNGEIYEVDVQILSLYFDDNVVIGTYSASYENIGVQKVCAEEYKLNGQYCEKTDTVDALIKKEDTSTSLENATTINATATSTYSCDNYGDGIILANTNMCYKTVTTNANYDLILTCPSGYTKKNSGNSDSTAYCEKTVSANKSIASTYCPSGYTKTNGGTTCQKSTTATSKQTCPSGYTLSGGKCTKTVTPTTTYLCSTGTLSGTKCITTTKLLTEYGYKCPSGYTKSGSGSSAKCTKTVSATKYAANTYCPSGYTKIGGATCQKSTTATSKQTCPSGYTLKSGKCTKTVSATKYVASTSCPSGYTKVGGATCQKTYSASKIPGTSQYKCSNGGTLSGTKCTITKSLTYNYGYKCSSGYTKSGSGSSTKCTKTVTPTTKYSCSTGTLSGTKCIVYTSLKTEYGYKCSSGYTKSGSGSSAKCTKTVSATKYAANTYCPSGYTKIGGATCQKSTTATSKQTCPSGYTLSGGKCTKTVTPTTTYLCSTGTLSGTKCITTTKLLTEYHYTCSQGTLSGTNCVITTGLTQTKKYVCPSGSTLDGTKCLSPGTYVGLAKTTITYSCPDGYTKTGSGATTKCVKK